MTGEPRDPDNWFDFDDEPREAIEPEPESTDKYEDRRKFIGTFAVLVGIVAAAGALKATVFAPQPSKAEKLANLIKQDTYSQQTSSAVDYLSQLTPRQVNRGFIKDRVIFGKKIQTAAIESSLAGFRQGLDNKGYAVDMFDIAEQLIPPNTQTALENDGVIFMPEEPVSCQTIYSSGLYVSEDPYSPIDYTNHAPDDFKVTNNSLDGFEYTLVPLGSEQVIDNNDLNPDDWAQHPLKQPTYSPPTPCVDAFPHPVYGPNQSTYPNPADFVVELY